MELSIVVPESNSIPLSDVEKLKSLMDGSDNINLCRRRHYHISGRNDINLSIPAPPSNVRISTLLAPPEAVIVSPRRDCSGG